MLTRHVRIGAKWLCAVAAVTVLSACSGTQQATTSGGPNSGTTTAERPSLDQFFDADSKTADFVLTSSDIAGGSVEMTGTLWVDGRKFRYTLSAPGQPVREVMSPDGNAAYFVSHEKKTAEPSVAKVDRYLVEFSEPATSSVEDGIDKETGATRVVYSIKELDDLAGADNPWYTEDMTFLVKDGAVIGTLTRGNVPDNGGIPKELRTTRRMLSNLKVGERIPAETFELPYSVKDAQ